jgi:hypothetical protein
MSGKIRESFKPGLVERMPARLISGEKTSHVPLMAEAENFILFFENMFATRPLFAILLMNHSVPAIISGAEHLL